MEVANISIDGELLDVDVEDGLAVIADYENNGIWLYDVSDPSSPVLYTFFDINRYCRNAFIVDSIAYICADHLWFVDISDPVNPEILGYYDCINSVFCACVENGFAYVASSLRTLHVVDISDFSNPVETSSFTTPYMGTIWGIDCCGEYVFYAVQTGELGIFSVLDPYHLVEVGSLETTDNFFGLDYYRNRVYLAAGETGGIRIVDVFDPANPFEVGYYDTPGYAKHVSPVDDYLIDADTYHFEIFNCSAALPVAHQQNTDLPTSFALSHPYPNPFNNEAAIQFSLPKKTFVSLRLYDIQGRVVETIANSEFNQGWHKVSFNADNLSSGVYFVNLEAGGYKQTKKITLLK